MFKDAKITIASKDKTIDHKGYRLVIPIFDFTVDLLIVNVIKNHENSRGCVFHEKGKYAALVEFTKESGKDVVIHESVHIAQALCWDMSAGDETTNDTKDELMAYITEYVSKEIFNLMDRINENTK